MTVTPSQTVLSTIYRLAAILAVAVALLWPAIYSGYPLIYYDSEDYVVMSFTYTPIVYRIMPYGFFLALAKPFGTLWAAVGIQALLNAWILFVFVETFAPAAWSARKRVGLFLLLGGALAAFTGLPWYVAQIIADPFVGPMVLGLAVLAFAPRPLSVWVQIAIVAVGAFSISVHMSHVAVAGGLLLVLPGLWIVSYLWARAPRPKIIAAMAMLAVGIALVPAQHYLASGQPVFSFSGRVLQLALFIQNGLAKRYLDSVCPDAGLKLCPYKDSLPPTADDFLWGAPTPFHELGGWEGLRTDADVIVTGAMRAFPQDVLRMAVVNVWQQLGLIAAGEDLDPKRWHFQKTARKYYPQEFDAYFNARQQVGTGFDFVSLNALQTPIAWAGQAAFMLVLIWAMRRNEKTTTGLALLILAVLIGNAIVCGAISNPHDRYQNRVVWLPMAVALLGATRLANRAKT